MKLALKPAIVYDLNGTLLRQSRDDAKSFYRKCLTDALSPLDKLSEDELATALGDRPEDVAELRKAAASKGGLAAALAELCHNPPRGTAARKVYYRLLHSSTASGDFSIKAIDGAVEQLKKTRSQGFVNIGFSRGPLYFVKHSVECAGLSDLLDEVFSTDDFGFDKKHGTFAKFRDFLAQRGYEVHCVFEDEPAAAQAAADDGVACFLVTDGRFEEAKKIEKKGK